MRKTSDLIKIAVTEVADLLGGTVEGKAREWILGLSKIDQGQPDTLTFLANQKYVGFLDTTAADIILINPDQQIDSKSTKTFIRVEDAYLGFCQVLNQYLNPAFTKVGIDSSAFVSDSSTIESGVYIGSNVHIGNDVTIGKNCKIYPNTFIGDGVKIGDNTVIHSNVSVYHETIIGQRGIIHAGTVIGSDGFGHAPKKDGSYVKIPQVGNVVIGDDVEIGANCAIDRATLGSTKIGNGVKLDNLIQIAHNVEIGANTVIAAQVGVSGSTILGERCMIGGQVGFAGHLKIANGTQVAAQSGLNKDIVEENTKLFGSPVMPIKEAFRSLLLVQKLPDMRDKLEDLEKQINLLRKELDTNGK